MSAPPTACSIIFSTSSSDGTAAGTQPPSRNRTSVSSASARTSACCSSLKPPWGNPKSIGSGRQVLRGAGEVAGDVGERREQRRELGLEEDLGDLVVRLGDRLERGNEGTRRPRGRLLGSNVSHRGSTYPARSGGAESGIPHDLRGSADGGRRRLRWPGWGRRRGPGSCASRTRWRR